MDEAGDGGVGPTPAAGEAEVPLSMPVTLTGNGANSQDGLELPHSVARSAAHSAGALLDMFRQAPTFLAVLHGPDHVFEMVNDAFYHLVGDREIIGKPVIEAMPEVEGQGFIELLDGVFATGVPFVGQELPVMLARSPDEFAQQRFVDFVYQAVTNPDGTRTGIVAHGYDVTDHVRARQSLEVANAQLADQALELELANQQLQDNATELEQQAEAAQILGEELEQSNAELMQQIGEAVRTGEVLRASDARLQVVLEATQLGTWALDLVTMATGRTPLHDLAFGYETMLPKWSYPMFLEHVHPDDRAEVDRKFQDTLATGAPWNFECRVIWPDRTVHWIGACSDIYRDRQGKPIRLLGSVQDITERKQVEREIWEQERQFRTLADTIPQLAWMTEADGSISWYNRRWYDYTGATPEAMAGWGWQSVHDPEHLPRVLDHWRTALELGEPWEDTFPLRGCDGVYRWFLSRASPIKDSEGRIVRWFGTNTDVTSVREARLAAEEANAAKSQFLAAMSHELRTPLNAIGGYTEILEMEIRGPITPQQRVDLERIKRSQQYLLRLINDVLNFAKLDAGQLEYRTLDVYVDAAVRETEAMIAPQIHAKGIHYSYDGCDPALMVLADREKVQQILLNLLTNATKFTSRGGSIALSCARDDRSVSIRVHDTGVGVPTDKLERIFEPFMQVERRLNRPAEGVGLGLSISRDLARGMGGDLKVESEPGVGSTFTLTLTLVEEHPREAVVQP